MSRPVPRAARLLAMVACGLLTACASSGAPAEQESLGAPPPVTLGVDDEGRRIELVVGQQLLVRLPASPSTGYAWAIRFSGSGLLRQEGGSYFAQDPSPGGLVGTGGVEVFRFTVAAAGEDDLRFEYRRGVDRGAAAGRVVTFRLSVR